MSNTNQEQSLDLSFSERNEGGVTTLEELIAGKTETPVVIQKEEIEVEKIIGAPELIVPPVIETPEIKVEKPLKEIVSPENGVDSSFKEIASKLVALGEWEAVDEIELEDGTKIPFDEVEVDEELFKTMVKYQNDLKQEKLLTNKTDTTGISDFTKKLIEIEKKGGDVKDALAQYQAVKDPLSQIDLGTEEGQEAAVTMHLKMAKMDNKVIQRLIKGYKEDGILAEESEKSVNVIESAFQEYMNSLEVEAEKAQTQRKESLKLYKNGLKESFKAFEINENLQKTLIDSATKEDENKKFEIDRIYNETRRDPKLAAELVFFLKDKEKYLEYKKAEVKVEVGLNNMRSLKFVKKSTDSINMTDRNKGLRDEIDLSKLKT